MFLAYIKKINKFNSMILFIRSFSLQLLLIITYYIKYFNKNKSIKIKMYFKYKLHFP